MTKEREASFSIKKDRFPRSHPYLSDGLLIGPLRLARPCGEFSWLIFTVCLLYSIWLSPLQA